MVLSALPCLGDGGPMFLGDAKSTRKWYREKNPKHKNGVKFLPELPMAPIPKPATRETFIGGITETMRGLHVDKTIDGEMNKDKDTDDEDQSTITFPSLSFTRPRHESARSTDSTESGYAPSIRFRTSYGHFFNNTSLSQPGRDRLMLYSKGIYTAPMNRPLHSRSASHRSFNTDYDTGDVPDLRTLRRSGRRIFQRQYSDGQSRRWRHVEKLDVDAGTFTSEHLERGIDQI